MYMYANLIRSRRLALGVSQVKLSALSGVSLPTIQNIEMNKANPSYATLESLCEILKLNLSIEAQPANLELLASAGLPLNSDVSTQTKSSAKELREELIKLCLSLQTGKLEERLKEATVALLTAIHSHYPNWYAAHLSSIPAVTKLLSNAPSGRIIKLSRIAKEKVSKIL